MRLAAAGNGGACRSGKMRVGRPAYRALQDRASPGPAGPRTQPPRRKARVRPRHGAPGRRVSAMPSVNSVSASRRSNAIRSWAGCRTQPPAPPAGTPRRVSEAAWRRGSGLRRCGPPHRGRSGTPGTCSSPSGSSQVSFAVPWTIVKTCPARSPSWNRTWRDPGVSVRRIRLQEVPSRRASALATAAGRPDGRPGRRGCLRHGEAARVARLCPRVPGPIPVPRSVPRPGPSPCPARPPSPGRKAAPRSAGCRPSPHRTAREGAGCRRRR